MDSTSIIYMVLAAAAAYLLTKRLRRGGKANASTIAEKIKSGARIVDVRSPAEFSQGSYPKARNIPLDSIASRLASLEPKDKAIVVFCASGSRSAQAARILRQSGFADITDAGGIGSMPR
jgi:phage shock protein E